MLHKCKSKGTEVINLVHSFNFVSSQASHHFDKHQTRHDVYLIGCVVRFLSEAFFIIFFFLTNPLRDFAASQKLEYLKKKEFTPTGMCPNSRTSENVYIISLKKDKWKEFTTSLTYSSAFHVLKQLSHGLTLNSTTSSDRVTASTAVDLFTALTWEEAKGSRSAQPAVWRLWHHTATTLIYWRHSNTSRLVERYIKPNSRPLQPAATSPRSEQSERWTKHAQIIQIADEVVLGWS